MSDQEINPKLRATRSIKCFATRMSRANNSRDTLDTSQLSVATIVRDLRKMNARGLDFSSA